MFACGVTFAPASFCMYSFDYSRDTLSVRFYPAVIADEMTTLSTSAMTAGRHVLHDGAKVLLLDKCYRLEGLRQLYVKGDVG